MRWIFCGCFVLLAWGGYALGKWVGQQGRRAAFLGLVVCIPIIGTRWLIRVFPSAAGVLFPFGWYGAVHIWWGFPLALFILGIPRTALLGSTMRRLVRAVCILVWVAFIPYLIGVLLFDPSGLKGALDAGGICRQTSNYSCGAAAAASLLHHVDVEASEREMAILCHTNPIMGTDPISVRYGVAEKLSGCDYDVEARRATWEELTARSEPAMALTKSDLLLDHWVVVLDANERAVLVADPTRGAIEYSRNEFLNKWRGIVVTIDRKPPIPFEKAFALIWYLGRARAH